MYSTWYHLLLQVPTGKRIRGGYCNIIYINETHRTTMYHSRTQTHLHKTDLEVGVRNRELSEVQCG